ncbi:hypothetical protein BH10PSE8_BH10PSE8_06380 [soil metagenome]
MLEGIARQILPPGPGFEWSALSYQEKELGGQVYIVYALSLLLVYLVLAGQYESWIAPLAIILSVPLARRARCWRSASPATSTPRSASCC